MGLIENLIQLRERRGLTQTEAARRLGITPVWLCNLEHGDGQPSLDLLRKIAELYGVSMSRLTKGE